MTKYTGRITQDEYAESPRDWDNLGTMVCFHRRYNLGDWEITKDEFNNIVDVFVETLSGMPDWDSASEYDDETETIRVDGVEISQENYISKQWDAIRKHHVILPIGLLDHSGLRIYEGSRNHSSDYGGWDSEQVGWIYVSYEKMKKEFNVYSITDVEIEKAKEILRSEIKIYDQYLSGDVYDVIIEMKCEKCEQTVQVDSSGGYYGYEHAEEIMNEEVEWWNERDTQKSAETTFYDETSRDYCGCGDESCGQIPVMTKEQAIEIIQREILEEERKHYYAIPADGNEDGETRRNHSYEALLNLIRLAGGDNDK